MLWRLFQGLQQCIEGLIGQHVHFVDDVDLVARATGPHTNIGSQLPDFIDTAIAGSIDFDHIDVLARIDGLRYIVVQRSGGWPARGVQSFGEDPGRGSFANSTSTCKQVGVPHPTSGDRLAKGLAYVFLANQFLKRLGPIAPGDNSISCIVWLVGGLQMIEQT